MKSKTLIRRLTPLALMLLFVIGSIRSNAQTDTINLRRHDVNLLLDNLQYQTQLNGNLKSGFDSLRKFYNDAVDSLNKYVGYLQSCMAERDTANAYISTLRTQISRVMTDRDKAIADAVQANNRKKKAFGIGPSIGWNPFTKSVYGGIGVHWSLVRFSLRGLFDGETKAEKYNPTIYSTLNH